MATIPPVPSFTANQSPSIATLNALASCVTFLNTAPARASLTNSGQNIPNTTETALSWTVSVDRDGGWASGHPTRYTAQTPGYYDLACQVDFVTGTGDRHAYYQVTTGSLNPGGAGVVTAFGGVSSNGDGTTDAELTIGAASPYLYVGDYLEVYAWQNSGAGLNTGTGSQWWITLISLGP